MKKILALVVILTLIGCETPYMITETITKDSTGKEIHTIVKKYSDASSTVVAPQASLNLFSSPFLWGPSYYYPYHYSPRIVVPIHPTPRYTPRGGRH